jgi:hypothetical protein
MKLFGQTDNEFSKLTEIDRYICIKLLDERSVAVRSWVDYLVVDYKKQGLEIDGSALLGELNDFAQRIKMMDE